MANLPSIKTLSTIFGENAGKARELLEISTAKIQTPEVVQLRRSTLGTLKKVDVRMTALDKLGEFSGVEYQAYTDKDSDVSELVYLNAGDSYVATLTYWGGTYRVMCLADIEAFITKRGCVSGDTRY